MTARSYILNCTVLNRGEISIDLTGKKIILGYLVYVDTDSHIHICKKSCTHTLSNNKLAYMRQMTLHIIYILALQVYFSPVYKDYLCEDIIVDSIIPIILRIIQPFFDHIFYSSLFISSLCESILVKPF